MSIVISIIIIIIMISIMSIIMKLNIISIITRRVGVVKILSGTCNPCAVWTCYYDVHVCPAACVRADRVRRSVCVVPVEVAEAAVLAVVAVAAVVISAVNVW